MRERTTSLKQRFSYILKRQLKGKWLQILSYAFYVDNLPKSFFRHFKHFKSSMFHGRQRESSRGETEVLCCNMFSLPVIGFNSCCFSDRQLFLIMGRKHIFLFKKLLLSLCCPFISSAFSNKTKLDFYVSKKNSQQSGFLRLKTGSLQSLTSFSVVSVSSKPQPPMKL